MDGTLMTLKGVIFAEKICADQLFLRESASSLHITRGDST
jgi:hypothetical protein